MVLLDKQRSLERTKSAYPWLLITHSTQRGGLINVQHKGFQKVAFRKESDLLGLRTVKAT